MRIPIVHIERVPAIGVVESRKETTTRREFHSVDESIIRAERLVMRKGEIAFVNPYMGRFNARSRDKKESRWYTMGRRTRNQWGYIHVVDRIQIQLTIKLQSPKKGYRESCFIAITAHAHRSPRLRACTRVPNKTRLVRFPSIEFECQRGIRERGEL